MYQPIDITLQVPCKLDSELKPKLTMRPPTTDDVLLAQKQSRLVVNGELVEDNGEHEAHLFANLTNTTRAFIGSMSQYDYLQLQKAYDCFCCHSRSMPPSVHCYFQVLWRSPTRRAPRANHRGIVRLAC